MATNHSLPTDDARDPPAIQWRVVTRRIREGDEEALSVYYEEFFDVMFHEVQRISGGDEASTLDLVQEAMLKAIRCMKVVSTYQSLAAWSRTVAKSVTYDWLRQRTRQTTHLRGIADVARPDSSSSLDDFARLEWLESQLKELPSDLQKLFSLRYRFGWSLKKIAQNLGLKTGAVDGRLRREIEKLKKKAQQEYQND